MEVIEKVENTNRTAIIPGGSFLIANPSPADCFFPEDFTEEHRQIAQTTADFATQRGRPRLRRTSRRRTSPSRAA